MLKTSKTIPRLMNTLVVAKEGANPIKVKNPTLYKIGRFFKGLLAKLQGKQNDMPTLEDKEFQKTELAHKVVVETLKNLPTKISEAKPEVTLYKEEGKFKIICKKAGLFSNTLEISAIDVDNNEHFKFILPNDEALEKYTNGLKKFDKYNNLERLTIKMVPSPQTKTEEKVEEIDFTQNYDKNKPLGRGFYGVAYKSKDGRRVLKEWYSYKLQETQFRLNKEDPSFRAARVFNEVQRLTGHPDLASARVVRDINTKKLALETPFIIGRTPSDSELETISLELKSIGLMIKDLRVPGNVVINDSGKYIIIDTDLRVNFSRERSSSFFNETQQKKISLLSPTFRT